MMRRRIFFNKGERVMDIQLFHIFRNTPLGRETLFQSLYFCNIIGASPCIYIPKHIKFLMYFENDVVQVDLDDSYLVSPETSLEHATEIAEQSGVKPRFITPKNFTASTLPDLPINFEFMCCPRSISDLSSKIGLGYIGPRVRGIVKSAKFPILITSPVYKKWKSIAVCFGGSKNAVKALKLGFRISRESGFPLEIFTHLEKGRDPEFYKKIIQKEGLEKDNKQFTKNWHFFESNGFEENLYAVPHDALAVVGAYGHNLIKDIFFGSKLEAIQSTISNNILIVGPNYSASM
jgi:hypothetical protein